MIKPISILVLILVLFQFSALAAGKKGSKSRDRINIESQDKINVEFYCPTTYNVFPTIETLTENLSNIAENSSNDAHLNYSNKINEFIKNANAMVKKNTLGEDSWFSEANNLLEEIKKDSHLLPLCSEFERKNKIEQTGSIASGSNGTVVGGCMELNCNIVIKQAKVSYGYELGDAVTEQNIFKLLAPEISPGTKGGYLCKRGKGNQAEILHNIILDKMDSSLSSYFKSHKEKIEHNQIQTIFNLVEQMHKKNVVHQDLHTSNILVKSDNNELKFYLTDFGCASIYSTGKPEETSKVCNNFRLDRTSGNKQKQTRYDYESLIYSFGRDHGVNIKVHLKKSNIYIPNNGAGPNPVLVEVDE